jgi:hypothetical protein
MSHDLVRVLLCCSFRKFSRVVDVSGDGTWMRVCLKLETHFLSNGRRASMNKVA